MEADADRRNGTPLQRIRAEQMIGIAAEGQIEIFVSELAQFVVIEVTIFSTNNSSLNSWTKAR